MTNRMRHPFRVPRVEKPRAEGRFYLPTGRRLGFAEFGDPSGALVLWFHGTPGGRRQFPLLGRRAAEKLGLRVVVGGPARYRLVRPAPLRGDGRLGHGCRARGRRPRRRAPWRGRPLRRRPVCAGMRRGAPSCRPSRGRGGARRRRSVGRPGRHRHRGHRVGPPVRPGPQCSPPAPGRSGVRGAAAPHPVRRTMPARPTPVRLPRAIGGSFKIPKWKGCSSTTSSCSARATSRPSSTTPDSSGATGASGWPTCRRRCGGGTATPTTSSRCGTLKRRSTSCPTRNSSCGPRRATSAASPPRTRSLSSSDPTCEHRPQPSSKC